jgi:hypothetical protein
VWPTVFVIDGEEHRLKKELPAFSKGAELLLYLTDPFDKSRVPKRFKVVQVILDIQTTLQYVTLIRYET